MKHVSPEELDNAKARLAEARGLKRTAFPAEALGGPAGTFIAVEFGLNEAGKLTSYATQVNAKGEALGPTVEGGTCPPWCEPPAGG